MHKKQRSVGNGMGEGKRQEFACWWRVLISFVGKGGLKLDLGPDFVRQLESRATCGTWGRGKPWGMVVSIWLVYLKEKATSANICVRKEYTRSGQTDARRAAAVELESPRQKPKKNFGRWEGRDREVIFLLSLPLSTCRIVWEKETIICLPCWK